MCATKASIKHDLHNFYLITLSMGTQWESVLIIQLPAHCDLFSRFHPYQDGQVPRKHINNRKGKTWGF